MSMYRLNPIRSSFLIPALILILIFVVYPIFATIMISFNINVVPGVDITNKPPSLYNYYKVVTDERFINLEGIKTHTFPMGAIVHNIIWLAIHLPLTLIIGILFAVYLQYVKGGSIIRSFIFIGMVIPMIVGGLLISFSFDKDLGVVNILLKAVGLGSFVKTWTIYPDTALFSLILGSVWLWSGFTVTMYSAGLSSIPREVIEAAIVDGADFKTILFKVIIPLLKPVTLTVVAMTILWDLKIFDIVYAATQGGPGGASTVLALLMYEYFARLGDYAMSATVATILTIIIIPVVVLWIKATLHGERK
ncbi:binding-protein-dependent transport systems inner membrane component [Staphylothermus marinus F1]|uniref:Binding-protein-dependent transport systems inner membrane component n=1 Tax=Staphylothermus marinus (strain ATCC 43588 / DSM 3639 / JCM 9404 / F1) TaxID=399550 RepID=A3DKP3_STAMF|nr:sugar ABC transporter permease [Staphylothermus marinus]ABN69203.1 binding-protein-dependent transport systems inner membrane component [Staphylothermus marinus F1]